MKLVLITFFILQESDWSIQKPTTFFLSELLHTFRLYWRHQVKAGHVLHAMTIHTLMHFNLRNSPLCQVITVIIVYFHWIAIII